MSCAVAAELINSVAIATAEKRMRREGAERWSREEAIMADTRKGTDLWRFWEKRQHVKGTGLLAYCIDRFEDAKTKTRGRQRLPRGYLI